MQITKLQKIVVNALEDVKAKDIVAYDTSKQSDLFQMIIIASGDSNRQIRALADRVIVEVKAAAGEILSSEGQDGGEWVLVDLGDIVVHIMLPTIRSHYNLEELWGKTEIKIKATTKRTFSASPSIEEDENVVKKRVSKKLNSNINEAETSNDKPKRKTSTRSATKETVSLELESKDSVKAKSNSAIKKEPSATKRKVSSSEISQQTKRVRKSPTTKEALSVAKIKTPTEKKIKTVK